MFKHALARLTCVAALAVAPLAAVTSAQAATPTFAHTAVSLGNPTAAASSPSYPIINEADGLCLDANDQGASAGQNGDKVQLWTCDGTTNQSWIPCNYEESGAYETVLANSDYPTMCLNATDVSGLKEGSAVQLWNCNVDTANEYWDFGDWISTAGATELHLDSGNFVLDATSQHLGNGDQVQIWSPLGGTNQLWY